MKTGVRWTPALANVAYAAVIPSRVTSPVPSASDGTLGHQAHAQLLRVVHRRRDADFFEQAHRGAVARRAQCRAQRHRGRRGVLVFGHPRALQRLNRLVEPVDDRRRRPPLFERRGKHERLERRPGLALGLDGAIELARLEAAAADQRAHVPGVRVERHQRAFKRRVVGRRALLATCRPPVLDFDQARLRPAVRPPAASPCPRSCRPCSPPW